MSMFDSLIDNLDNLDDVAAKLGIPPDKVQAVVGSIQAKVAGGSDHVAALTAVAQEHGISLDRLKAMLPEGGAEGLMAKATSMLDRDGDGNPLNDLGGMAKGLFGSKD